MKLYIIFLLFFHSQIAFSQASPKKLIQTTDSTYTSTPLIQDENTTTKDTLTEQRKDALDTIVSFSAKKVVSYYVQQKKLILVGNANLSYKNQKLKSEIIELNFDNATLKAEGVVDSNKKISGFPKFYDGNEVYVGEKFSYNFKTKQGVISLGETEIGEGFYFGSKIKKISDNEYFIKDGCYTTCDAPHPHYYFGSPKMKVITGEKIFIDPIIFYVEDLPLFIVPFGLFFPNKSGRQSGFVVPSFFFSANRGVTLENIGLYLALSDYYDTQFLVDIYSKGGYTLKNSTRWALTHYFSGNAEIQYGKTRFNPAETYTTNWSLRFNHNHTLTPQSRFTANLNFSSKNFNKNTSYNIEQRLQQFITSRASYYENFDNGTNFSISYSRDQNIITNAYTQGASASYSIPQYYPLKDLFDRKSFFGKLINDFNFSYSINANWNEDKSLTTKLIKISDDSSFVDTSFVTKNSQNIQHRPSISISPKFGYFTISPSISFSANNYFRRLKRVYNITDSTTTDEFETGFFTEYNYTLGISVSTKLYGILKPKLFSINAIRHTFQPSISLNYTPDLSAEKFGFYGRYFDVAQNKEVIYSRFEKDNGGIASRFRSQSLNFSFANSIEAKIAQGDTSQDKNIEIIRFNLNGGYNFVADSLKFSDISMNFRTPTIANISFTGNARFSLYDEDRTIDAQGNPTNNFHRVNRFLISAGKGLARLTNLGFQISTSISSQNLFPNSSMSFSKNVTDTAKEEFALGKRFQERYEHTETHQSPFGDDNPGYSPLILPWEITLGLNFQYSEPTLHRITRSINLSSSFSLKLTETWSIKGTADYDFVNKELLAPVISITKDLHCWQLDFQWYPVGYSAGFYLRFGIKSALLKDLKFEKRSSPLLR